MRERILGPEHPDTVTVRCNFAFRTGLAGDPAATRDLLADLLPVLERISGPEHPDTLTVRRQPPIGPRKPGQVDDPTGPGVK